jgi:hypothetical protein
MLSHALRSAPHCGRSAGLYLVFSLSLLLYLIFICLSINQIGIEEKRKGEGEYRTISEERSSQFKLMSVPSKPEHRCHIQARLPSRRPVTSPLPSSTENTLRDQEPVERRVPVSSILLMRLQNRKASMGTDTSLFFPTAE